MWEVVTSFGHRARDVRDESDARHIVHSLGLATLIAPGRKAIADNRGQRFVAEIRQNGLPRRYLACTHGGRKQRRRVMLPGQDTRFQAPILLVLPGRPSLELMVMSTGGHLDRDPGQAMWDRYAERRDACHDKQHD